MNGQGMIGRDCAWCGLPAVGDVEVQPAQYRTVSQLDAISGQRTAQRRLVRAAIVVAACEQHQQITRGQAAPVWTPRERRARDVEQPELFVSTDAARLRNAIYGETDR